MDSTSKNYFNSAQIYKRKCILLFREKKFTSKKLDYNIILNAHILTRVQQSNFLQVVQSICTIL